MKKIKSINNKEVIVDDDIYKILNKIPFVVDKNNRVTLKHIRLSKLVLQNNNPNLVIDHINRNPLDNRRENLRLITRSSNQQNRNKPKNNTSGYKGVWKQGSKWVAQIRANRKKYTKGLFNTPEEAAMAYNEMAIKLHGNCAVLN